MPTLDGCRPWRDEVRMTTSRIAASDEAWDRGELGRDNRHAKATTDNIESRIDSSLDLQLISVRLQKSLIDDLKGIAALNGIGYQPLMRQVLKRFVDGEKKKILKDRVAEMRALAATPTGKAAAGAAGSRSVTRSRKKAA